MWRRQGGNVMKRLESKGATGGRTMLIVGMTLTLITGGGAFSRAADTILSDTFNDDSGDLTGQTADSGQVWAAKSGLGGSLTTGTQYGQGGTVGAGATVSGTSRGNALPVAGTGINRRALIDAGGGTYTIGIDINKKSAVEVGFSLYDGSDSVGFVWWQNQLSLGGNIDIWNIGAMTTPWSGGQLRAELKIEVDTNGNSTATFSYAMIADPDGNPASQTDSLTGTASDDFAYDSLGPWLDGGNGSDISGGFDNLSVKVGYAPPPAGTFVLDRFNDDSGDLTGETADTGQVWGGPAETWQTASLVTGPQYGQGGTIGAGHTVASGGRGNALPVSGFNRQALIDRGGGSFTIGIDINKKSAVEVGFSLYDGSDSVGFVWWQNQLSLGGNIDIWNIGAMTTPWSGGQLRAELKIEVDTNGNSTATFSYAMIADPDGNPASQTDSLTGTASDDFAYDSLGPWLDGGNGSDISGGFDNLSVVGPPPPPAGTAIIVR